MKGTTLLTAIVLVVSTLAGSTIRDIETIESILEVNRLNWDVYERVTVQNGRVISLNLSSPSRYAKKMVFLPRDIGKLSHLRFLSLNNNDLVSLPKELFNLRELRTLEISNNNILALPRGIERLRHLQTLNLSNNGIHEVPTGLSKSKSLVRLRLNGNAIGNLPIDIGDVVTLKEIDLTGNQLSELPSSITRLSLKRFDIVDNALCGIKPRMDAWVKTHNDNYLRKQYCVIHYNDE